MDHLVSDAPPASMAALRLHGLDPGLCQVRGRPARQLLENLIARLGPGPVEIVAHPADFERGFLEAWANREGRELPDIHWSCTLEQARPLALPPHSATAWATALGWDCSGMHRARCNAALAERLQWAMDA